MYLGRAHAGQRCRRTPAAVAIRPTPACLICPLALARTWRRAVVVAARPALLPPLLAGGEGGQAVARGAQLGRLLLLLRRRQRRLIGNPLQVWVPSLRGQPARLAALQARGGGRMGGARGVGR